jgi:hypothetical protein
MFRLSRSPVALRLLVVALLTAPLAARPADSAGVNRLSNPGFEQSLPGHPWMPAGWDTSRSGLSSVFFGRDTMLVHDGRYAVTVANVSALWPFSHNWSQTVLVNRGDWGKDAVFSVWTRSAGIDGHAYVLLQAYRDTISRVAKEQGVPRDSMALLMGIHPVDDPLYDLGWKRASFAEQETGWVRREVRIFVPPLANVIFVRCGLIGVGQLMVDDASLTFEPARPAAPVSPHTNLLADPGFENGGLDWEFSLPPYRGMIGIVDSTEAHSGRYCALFTGGEEGWASGHVGACQAISNRNLQGKRLRLTGWFKTDSLKSNAYTKFYFHTLHGVEQIPTNNQFSGTKDWSKATLEADVPRDAYEVWVWYVYNGPAEGKVRIDDCSVEVIPPDKDRKKTGAR